LKVEGRVADYRRVIEHAVTRSLSPESKNMSEAGRPILHEAMTLNIADLKRRFAEAKPFRHVLIENFLRGRCGVGSDPAISSAGRHKDGQ